MLYLTLAVLVLLCCSALTSGTETAMTGASRARIYHLASEGDRRAAMVQRLLEQQERLLGALLLGNNLFNILATALAADVLIHLAGEAGVAYATLIMTALVVIFAEVLPKTYAIRNPEQMARAVAPAAQVLVALFAPVTRLIQWLVNRTLGLFGVPAQAAPLSSALDALRGTIALHAQAGAVEKHERDMLAGILDLAHVEVSEIMTHRKSMETINADSPIEQILEQVVATPTPACQSGAATRTGSSACSMAGTCWPRCTGIAATPEKSISPDCATHPGSSRIPRRCASS